MARKAQLGRKFAKPIGVRPRKPAHLRITRRPAVPPGLTSEYEVRVWQALVGLGYQPRLQQAFRGGTAFPGGMRVDFVLPEVMTVVRVMSWYHEDPAVRARDEYQSVYLQSLGFQVLDCWAENLPTVGAVRRWLQANVGTPTA